MSGDANEATEADEAANADEATHFTGPRARALGDVWEGGARKSEKPSTVDPRLSPLVDFQVPV